LVVVLIFASVYLLRKFVYNRREFTSRNKAIQVLSTTYVGPKKSLLLVEAAGKILVLSATESQMNLITELEKEAYEEFIRGSLEEKNVSNSAGNQFGEILSKFLKRPK
ncbi:flagellar biosynthetic protein FliO, partial [candidate division KSB1 bacterium]|nr:flagellar biosynthetic protein FliO [candidate division KSB1 bacterium]